MPTHFSVQVDTVTMATLVVKHHTWSCWHMPLKFCCSCTICSCCKSETKDSFNLDLCLKRNLLRCLFKVFQVTMAHWLVFWQYFLNCPEHVVSDTILTSAVRAVCYFSYSAKIFYKKSCDFLLFNTLGIKENMFCFNHNIEVAECVLLCTLIL